MTDAPIFRQIKPSELDDLLDLYHQFLGDGDPLPERAEVEAVWATILTMPHHQCLVAEVDGKVVASCVLQMIPNLRRGTRPYAIIENVVTHGDYQRRGIGTSLLHHALAIAWGQNCYKAMLMTGSKDPATLRFYEKAGFAQGVKTGFVATP